LVPKIRKARRNAPGCQELQIGRLKRLRGDAICDFRRRRSLQEASSPGYRVHYPPVVNSAPDSQLWFCLYRSRTISSPIRVAALLR
jgi:hypothetical protein